MSDPNMPGTKPANIINAKVFSGNRRRNVRHRCELVLAGYVTRCGARNVDAYLKTGSFPEGTLIVKELTRLLSPTFPDGSRTEPSGRGFFNGEYNGIDATVKDSKKFAKTNGWGFFTFGHHPLPYEQSAAESFVTECAGCHIANVAKTDMTWVQFYPLLRDKKGY